MNPLTAIKYGAIAVVVSVIASGIWWITGLRADLAISEANNIKLEHSLETQKKAYQELENDIIDIQRLNQELNTIAENQQNEIRALNEKFNVRANGTSRDFGAIARSRPTLINRIINRATDNVNRCMELATGAELKEGEKNNECKELIRSLTE